VLFQRCYYIGVVAATFLNAENSVGGHVKKSITLSFFIWQPDVEVFSK